MGELLVPVAEAVGRLANLIKSDVDLPAILHRQTPQHAHWRERRLGNGTYFRTGSSFNRWLNTYGLLFNLRARAIQAGEVALDFLMAMETQTWMTEGLSAKGYCQFFAHNGIPAEVYPLGATLFNHRAGAILFPTGNWDPQSVPRFLPEVDFKIDFFANKVSVEQNKKLKDQAGIELNTVQVGGGRYNIHLIGHPPLYKDPSGERTRIKDGEAYLARLDKWLKEEGFEAGIDNLYVTRRGMRIIRTFEDASIPK